MPETAEQIELRYLKGDVKRTDDDLRRLWTEHDELDKANARDHEAIRKEADLIRQAVGNVTRDFSAIKWVGGIVFSVIIGAMALNLAKSIIPDVARRAATSGE